VFGFVASLSRLCPFAIEMNGAHFEGTLKVANRFPASVELLQ
jgi:hypothetical protein